MTNKDIWLEAKCANHDTPELFFSDDHQKWAASYTAQAIKICEECPIRTPCAEYAYKRGEWGVWGATTREQREDRRRKARAA